MGERSSLRTYSEIFGLQCKLKIFPENQGIRTRIVKLPLLPALRFEDELVTV